MRNQTPSAYHLKFSPAETDLAVLMPTERLVVQLMEEACRREGKAIGIHLRTGHDHAYGAAAPFAHLEALEKDVREALRVFGDDKDKALGHLVARGLIVAT